MNEASKAPRQTACSRRSLWKIIAAGMLAGIMAPAIPLLSAAHAATPKAGKRKILIVCYSRTGNTQEIASQIQALVGGDIVVLQTVDPYPDDYKATTKQAKEELKSGYRPPLKTAVADFASYDVIFLGSPNWWGTIAPPVMTFLSQYDMSGKTIAPFITHEGSRLGRNVEDIAAMAPRATVLEGLAVRGGSVKIAQTDVKMWLSKLGMKD